MKSRCSRFSIHFYKICFGGLISLLSALKPSYALDASQVFNIASKSVVVVIADGGKTLGSGVVINVGGYPDSEFRKLKPEAWIVTNCHVVKNAKDIEIRFERIQYPGVLEFSDEQLDICLLSAKDLPAKAAAVAKRKSLVIGEKVFAVGAPQGLEQTISEGIISSLRKNSNETVLIQTSAPISPGSSGGGLFDASGNLVGITTFQVLGGQNLNFAVAADYALEIKEAAYAAGFLKLITKLIYDKETVSRFGSTSFNAWLVGLNPDTGSKHYVTARKLVEKLPADMFSSFGISPQLTPQMKTWLKEVKSFLDQFLGASASNHSGGQKPAGSDQTERWKLLHSDNTSKIYRDRRSLSREGDIVRYWTLTDYAQPQSSEEGAYLSMLIFKMASCTQKSVTFLQAIWYSENMGGGTVIKKIDLSGWSGQEPTFYPPGSVGEAEIETLCQK
jgi:hypothetical protein